MENSWWIILIIWNVITFFAYGLDKLKAIKHQWRIPEKTLLSMAYCFGGFGAYAGMKFFHHKTVDKAFKYTVPAVALIELFILMRLCG